MHGGSGEDEPELLAVGGDALRLCIKYCIPLVVYDRCGGGLIGENSSYKVRSFPVWQGQPKELAI